MGDDAAHCDPQVGDTVLFFTTGPNVGTSGAATTLERRIRPGVNPATLDLNDDTGRWADLALLRVAAIPATSLRARLAWTYPGSNHGGYLVGSTGTW